MTASDPFTRGLRTFATDIAEGFLEITHNGFALIGLAVMCGALTLITQPELRQAGESQLFGWLQTRQGIPGVDIDLGAIDRATASNPQALPKRQADLAYWLSRKYRVAPEPLSAIVAEAYEIGQRSKLEPTLILAVMAIESGFNPFAQSPMGAQGLMQVITRVHSDKYDNFGGVFAAFDPLTNLRVGARVLEECISRAGSTEAGLKFYVGAANIEDDGGYVGKVLAEHGRLQAVAAGRTVPDSAAATPAAPAAGKGAKNAESVALLTAL
ncbi:MAG: lytic transglycosylase domain-containing protein [Betaproteobacteria bacterium]|jgi:hypothetical protein|nr:lytic transglycosylase domain-containing protein [Betaproteobacteria bacterium]